MDNNDYDDYDESPRPTKRFKHTSYQASLKSIHAPTALTQFTTNEEDIGDTDSHFRDTLERWQQLNTSPTLVEFTRKVGPMCASMPLLVHHWREVVSLWEEMLEKSDEEALKPLFDLLQKLTHDLRTTLTPIYIELVQKLVIFLPKFVSTPALTALLAAFSSIFRALLVPSNDPLLFEHTWSILRETLPKCQIEIQRTVGEVWSGVLRRASPEMRISSVKKMVVDSKGVEDPLAWCFVHACKSVSQTLHTASVSILTPLFNSYTCASEISTPKEIFLIIKRVLTALAHHVKDATRFEPIADALTHRLLSSTDSNTRARTLEICTIPLSVRKGARMTNAQLSTLLQHHKNIPDDTDGFETYTVALITAGDMSLWMTSGRNILEQLWQSSPKIAVRLSGALAEVGWGGWKMIGLPLVMKNTKRDMDDDMIALLADLKREEMLGEVDVVWRVKVENWIRAKLETGDYMKSQLDDILVLSTFAPSILPKLAGIVDKLIKEPSDDHASTPINSAWVLESTLKVLSKNTKENWITDVNLAQWTRSAVKNWSWSGGVLGALVEVASAISVGKYTEPISAEELYPHLQISLMSHSQTLRLAALKLLLCSNLVTCSQNEMDVLKRCLSGEEVTLDAQGVRERVLRIGRVGQVVKAEGIGKDICVRWLLGQLKVNLKPIWSPALAALASLSTHVGDVVWEVTFEELQRLSQGEVEGANEPKWKGEEIEGEGENDKWEEERTWRDPSAHKLRQAVRRWSDIEHMRSESIKAQQPSQRFDPKMYETQILAVFIECRALAEKHNRDLISLFISLRETMPKPKLLAWLNLFSKFSNPKAVYTTNELYALYLSLLSHPDRPTQKLALECLFTYKDTHLVRYADRIKLLLDDSRWRDELTLLNLNELVGDERSAVINVVTRLLFGLMLERRGKGRGGDRRAAVLTTLSACSTDELGVFVNLMLKPMGADKDAWANELFVIGEKVQATPKQQVGYLTLLGDVIKNLGPQLLTYWPALVGTTIRLSAQAQSTLQGTTAVASEDEDAENAEDVDDDPVKINKAARSIRQLSLKRLAGFFKCPVDFDFRPFMQQMFNAVISPRLPTLAAENTQAPSSLLELFYAWAIKPEYASFLWQYDEKVLSRVFDCLIATSVKPEAVLRIFDIVDSLLSVTETNGQLVAGIEANISLLLSNLSLLLDQKQDVAATSTPLGQRLISILSRITVYCTDAWLAVGLQKLLVPLLKKSFKVVPEKIKVDLLKSLNGVMDLIPELGDETSQTYAVMYDTISRLFQALRFRPARTALTQAFSHLAKLQPKISGVASLMEGLNAYSTKRLDEPDFNTRLATFTMLNETLHSSLLAQHWLPVVYSMLLFIQDPAELSIRTNAAHSLCLFINRAACSPSSDFEITFGRVVYPGLKRIVRSKTESVRAEAVGVVAHAVTKCDNIASLVELRPLLAGGDEEASFFANIHHIQTHRRTRALRRLAEQCELGTIRSSTIADILLPLVGHFVTSSENLDHHLVNEAVVTTGKLSKKLLWGSYYALVQKYLKLSKDKQQSEKVYTRTLLAILENFHFSMDTVVEEVSDEKDEDEDDLADTDEKTKEPLQAIKTAGKITDAVNLRLLPSLIHHLEKHDASTEDSARIPIAVGIIQVAQHLPPAPRTAQVDRLLTVLSQIFRSKSQETRDLTRDTLCRIAVILGPERFSDILRELRAALTRGPQLHVLAHLTHHLLVYLTTGEHAALFTTLDASIDDIAHISAEVIFGQSGKDVQSENFKTKMREVRSSSSKSLDSFTIISKFVTPSHIGSLLTPIRGIMHETETAKTMGLVDEVLKRIASGLNSNPHLVPTELLVLCHTLISQNAKFLKQVPPRIRKKPKGDAIVQLKRNLGLQTDHYSVNSYRFVVLGLDLLHTALRRNRFDFKDTQTISRLDPMVTVVGNTLYSSSAAVLILGLKVAVTLCKCPLLSLAKSLPVIVQQTLNIIKQVGNTDSEIVQTAFKSLAAILRDGLSAEVKEKDLIYLLELLSPDLEDPSRQTTAFTLLRAIVGRKFVVPEIYDLMDRVAEITVTSQSPQVQEMCRGVLLQFLLDYPQGKGRLRKQLTFLVKNLTYVYESGRKSVIELLGAIIAKFQENLVQEYADMVFVGLVMVMANDDSTKCKEMAAQLTKTLMTRLDKEHIGLILTLVHSWAAQNEQASLTWVAFHVYGLALEALSATSEPYTIDILNNLSTTLQQTSTTLAALENNELEEHDEDEETWQVPYYALVALSKLFVSFPAKLNEFSLVPWDAVIMHLLYPHSWVRTAASRLLGVLFAAIPVDFVPGLNEHSPLSQSSIQDIAKKSCLQLKSEHLDEPLALQIVKNLFYIAKRFAHHNIGSSEVEVAPGDEAEDDENVHQFKKSALSWLFSRLSFQIRSAQISRRNRKVTKPNWHCQLTAILQLFAALTSYLPSQTIEDYLLHMLSPIYRIADDDTIRDPKMADLKVLAVEVQELIQTKVGVTKFSTVYNQVRQGILTVRKDRKAANALQVVANPEAAAKRKFQKNVIKKESRKRKNVAFADGKGRLKRTRDRE